MWRMMMITYSGFDHWGFTMFYHVSPCFTHEKVTVTRQKAPLNPTPDISDMVFNVSEIPARKNALAMQL